MKSFLALLVLCSALVPICPAEYGTTLQTYDFGTAEIVRDPIRNRVYCTVPDSNSVAVIDTDSLSVVAMIFSGSNPHGCDVSADGNYLAVANSGTTIHGISIIDLRTLSHVRYIATTYNPRDVAIGESNIVYALELASPRWDSLINAYTLAGTQLSGSITDDETDFYSGSLQIAPDRKSLAYYQNGVSSSDWYRMDLSTWPATVVASGEWGNGGVMDISPDGQFVSFAAGAPYYIRKIDYANSAVSYGQYDTGAYPRSVAYGPAGARVYATHTGGHIDVWNATTFLKIDEINRAGSATAYDLETDRSGRVLFAGSGEDLTAHLINSPPSQANPPVEIMRATEIRWASRLGTVYQVEWTSSLNSDLWIDLGGPMIGTGLTMSAFDTARDTTGKFYRVREVQ